MDSNAASLLTDFTALRSKKSGLQTWISIGGWSFNDPGNSPDTRAAFGDMTSTAANRATLEYPVADDRGGKKEDKANYVLLVKEMKDAFKGKYGISITLPASYWYLQHFDVVGMEPYVSWFNMMTYDIHGVWDSSNRYTGPQVRPHTNLTEIDVSLSLLWRAGVSAANVVMGLGFYGRSFTLTDPTCTDPGCAFSEGGKAEECSNAAGILTAAEIGRIIEENNLTPSYDEKAAVKWMSWDSNQWVNCTRTTSTLVKLATLAFVARNANLGTFLIHR
ncbi:hypothetical protein VE02_03930 [Pseudogymnoascus sp. 03VT05]|nr:hypothetical protein VE02_03930 [Pseudogymnoascus sp. 03VT05]